MKSGNIEQFVHLSKFIDKDEFNSHIEQWMVDFKNQFTKSELIGLKRLIRYSCKYAGISNAKIQTLVSATHNKEIGISRSTFERMLRKAKQYGILTVHNTFCGSNQRHNVYVFNRYQSIRQVESQSYKNEVPETIDVANQETSHAETNNINTKRNNTRLDATYASMNVPARLTGLIACYYNDAKIIEEFWRVITVSTYYLTHYSQQDKEEMAIMAFKQLIRAIKFGKKAKNIFGLYYSIVTDILDREHMKIVISA
ncbi:hypothetical protein ABEP50_16030 [Priestia megaterium]